MALKQPTKSFRHSLEILVIDQSDIDFARTIMYDTNVLDSLVKSLNEDLPNLCKRILDESYNYVYVAESSRTGRVVGLIEKAMFLANQSFFYAVVPFYHAALEQWPFKDDEIMKKIQENEDKSILALETMLLREAEKKTGKFSLEIRNVSQRLISMSSRFESLKHSTLNNILAFYQEADAQPGEEVVIQ